MKRLSTAALLAVGVTMLSSSCINLPVVHANELTTGPDPSVIALEINPEQCSDAASNSAFWQVTNKNSTDVILNWRNIDSNVSGVFDAKPGTTRLATSFDASDPNNTTRFEYAGNMTQTNAQSALCQATTPVVVPPLANCVDGSDAQNLVVEFLADNEVSVHTKNNQLLCNNVQIYFSSYLMPDNYDGTGFAGNPTATPQDEWDNDSTTLLKGTNGTIKDLIIALPDECQNTQVDVYYAPEIQVVTPAGHGTQNIVGKIYPKTADNCDVQPGNGGGNTAGSSGDNTGNTPSTGTSAPAPVAATSASVNPGMGANTAAPANTKYNLSTAPNPSQLSNTGQTLTVPYAAAAILTALTAATALISRRPKLQ